MADENDYLISTCAKDVCDVKKFFKWMTDNNVIYFYVGSGRYYIRGEEHATMVKLMWGA